MQEDPSAAFKLILESSLNELVELRTLGDSDSIENFYADVILSFLRCELVELAASIAQSAEKFSSHPEFEFLKCACQLRLRIRERSFDPDLFDQAKRIALVPSRWQGELALLLATLSTVYEKFGEGREWFEYAAKSLSAQGVNKKALRARMNSIVCLSHLEPERNLLSQYHDLYRQSLKKHSRDLVVTTTCLLNISREYQRAGAPLAALKYAERGLEVAEFQFGSLNHHLLLAHRAHILCELGRVQEAAIDSQLIKLSPFPEVKAALELLQPFLQKEMPGETQDPNLLPTWRERADELREHGLDARYELSGLEQRLIEFLSKGPRNRVDILEHLYGEKLSYETKLGRLKSLLSNLRRKFPNLVLYEADSYRLSETLLVPWRIKKAQGEGA